MELHVCAVGKDANNETKEVEISVFRTMRTRQLTEKAVPVILDYFLKIFNSSTNILIYLSCCQLY